MSSSLLSPPCGMRASSVRLTASLLSELHSLISLDRGCSSTKIVFARVDSDNVDEFDLVCLQASNSNFEQALEWVREQTRSLERLEGASRVALTGGGGFRYMRQIGELLNAQPVFVDELVGQARGCAWLVENAAENEIFFDDPFLTELDEPVNLPGLFVFSGSGNGLVLVHPDGSKCQDNVMMHGGKAFLSYGYMLTGTSSYDEILHLAEKGNRDLVLKDERTFALPKDQLDALTREDKALAVVQWFSQWVAYFVHSGICASQQYRLFLGCNFWQGRLMRELFMRNLTAKLDQNQLRQLKVRAFKIGHTGTIGSMVTAPDDVGRYVRTDGFCCDP